MVELEGLLPFLFDSKEKFCFPKMNGELDGFFPNGGAASFEASGAGAPHRMEQQLA